MSHSPVAPPETTLRGRGFRHAKSAVPRARISCKNAEMLGTAAQLKKGMEAGFVRRSKVSPGAFESTYG
jgi:hypothetical protein